MKTLVLCRHAKSDWSFDLPDFERPLNGRGRRDVKAVGAQLKYSGFFPDLIVTSPAVRALTTAQAIAEATGLRASLLLRPEIYEASVGDLISVFNSLPSAAQTVMVFGHNPGMEGAAGYLLQTALSVTMPTGAMVCLQVSGEWTHLQPGGARLQWMLIPRQLREAGFADSKED